MSDDEQGIGEELDLEAVEREATKVKRRALDLDFQEVADKEFGHLGGGREHGGGGLEADAFLSKREKEALDRARGGKPTLKKTGQEPRRKVQPAAGPRMEQALNIKKALIPGWAWAMMVVLIIGGALTIGGVLFYRSYEERIADEEALLQSARDRARTAEEERLRNMSED